VVIGDGREFGMDLPPGRSQVARRDEKRCPRFSAMGDSGSHKRKQFALHSNGSLFNGKDLRDGSASRAARPNGTSEKGILLAKVKT